MPPPSRASPESPDAAGLLFELLIESVLDHALFTLDDAGRISSWNRGCERIFGRGRDEALGQPFGLVYPPELSGGGQPERDLDEARRRGQVDLEGWRCRGNGVSIWTRTHISWFGNGRSHPNLAFAVVTRDLTELRRLLDERNELRRQLRSVLETAVDAIVIIDEGGNIESFNRGAERMFGYRTEEVRGENVAVLMPQPFASEHTGYIQQYLRTGEAKVIGIGREVVCRRKDGTTFPAYLSVSEFFDGRRQFTGILRDLSDLKRLQSEVLQMAESEQRRIGQELHDDTQQQLVGLTMLARSACEFLVPLLPVDHRLAELQRRLQRIAEGLREASQSVRTLARGLVPSLIDAHGLPEALVRLAEQVQESTGIDCRCEVEEGVGVEDAGVATHLYRITQEAVGNAVRHGKPSTVVIRLAAGADSQVLTVSDDGTGMPDQGHPVGRGLQIMAHRAGLIGAVLYVRPGKNGGTVVTCVRRNKIAAAAGS